MDASTEKMENLRWARILVQTKRGELPSSIEIGVEETTYHLPLWWEVKPMIRQKTEDCRGATVREERDDGGARAGRRVEEWGSAGLEALLRSDDVTEVQADGMGRVSSVGRIQFGSMLRASEDGAEDGLTLDGLNGPNLGMRRDGGPSLLSTFGLVGSKEVRSGGLGPTGRSKGPKGKEIVLEEDLGPRFGLSNQSKCSGPSSSWMQENGAQLGGPPSKKRTGPKVRQPKSGPMEALVLSGLLGEANIELEFLRAREKETEIAQKVSPLKAMVDSVLQDEAMRYEALSSLGVFWESGNPSLSSLFSLDRTPEGQFFDHSRVLREVCQNGRELQRQGAAGSRASGSACWDMVEFKGPLATAREQEGGPSQFEIQEERGEGDLDWQESSLARFSQFLGFSTDGLEKDILNFLVKIRKRREKIHSKGFIGKIEV